MAPAQDQETEMQRPTFTETWMDLDSVIQSEVSQKEKHVSYINGYMWTLEKFVLTILFTRQK